MGNVRGTSRTGQRRVAAASRRRMSGKPTRTCSSTFAASSRFRTARLCHRCCRSCGTTSTETQTSRGSWTACGALGPSDGAPALRADDCLRARTDPAFASCGFFECGSVAVAGRRSRARVAFKRNQTAERCPRLGAQKGVGSVGQDRCARQPREAGHLGAAGGGELRAHGGGHVGSAAPGPAAACAAQHPGPAPIPPVGAGHQVRTSIRWPAKPEGRRCGASGAEPWFRVSGFGRAVGVWDARNPLGICLSVCLSGMPGTPFGICPFVQAGIWLGLASARRGRWRTCGPRCRAVMQLNSLCTISLAPWPFGGRRGGAVPGWLWPRLDCSCLVAPGAIPRQYVSCSIRSSKKRTSSHSAMSFPAHEAAWRAQLCAVAAGAPRRRGSDARRALD
jgi:hypothetical protein